MTNPAFKTTLVVGNTTVITDVDDLLVLRSNFVPGNMWGTGTNVYGELGNAVYGEKSSPITVGSLTNWQSITASSGDWSSAGITTSGNLSVWGNNSSGQLGLGDTNGRSTPTQVGALTWKQVCFSGDSHGTYALAIRSDGSLWGWGDNSAGNLANGTLTSTSSPVQAGSRTDWKIVCAGYDFALAIANDGSLWGWGTQSVIYTSATAIASTPVQIGSNTNWKSISAGGSSTGFALAISYDNTLWGWGSNYSGQLGAGTVVSLSSLTQLGSAGFWKSAVCSTVGHHVVAVSVSGALYTWGLNNVGQLGNGDSLLNIVSTPVQIGSLTNWMTPVAGGYSSGAIKTDGSAWGWGYNTSGMLGISNASNISSPVQIGSNTNWKSMSMGSYHSLLTAYSF